MTSLRSRQRTHANGIGIGNGRFREEQVVGPTWDELVAASATSTPIVSANVVARDHAQSKRAHHNFLKAESGSHLVKAQAAKANVARTGSGEKCGRSGTRKHGHAARYARKRKLTLRRTQSMFETRTKVFRIAEQKGGHRHKDAGCASNMNSDNTHYESSQARSEGDFGDDEAENDDPPNSQDSDQQVLKSGQCTETRSAVKGRGVSRRNFRLRLTRRKSFPAALPRFVKGRPDLVGDMHDLPSSSSLSSSAESVDADTAAESELRFATIGNGDACRYSPPTENGRVGSKRAPASTLWGAAAVVHAEFVLPTKPTAVVARRSSSSLADIIVARHRHKHKKAVESMSRGRAAVQVKAEPGTLSLGSPPPVRPEMLAASAFQAAAGPTSRNRENTCLGPRGVKSTSPMQKGSNAQGQSLDVPIRPSGAGHNVADEAAPRPPPVVLEANVDDNDYSAAIESARRLQALMMPSAMVKRAKSPLQTWALKRQ